jgi:anion-transporting  ArsA/GET3 family ATPase
VLTIDPARRLATSLGISDISEEPRRIDLPGNSSGGEMWAMMLDIRHTFDRLIDEYAPTEEIKRTIFENKVYQRASRMVAGSQEYMAMEKLHDIHQQKRYDVIVLDTPPTQNAVSFLEAPQKMMGMIDNSMLNLLLKPYLFVGKTGFKLFEKGTKQIFKIFDKIAGSTVLEDLSEMFLAFKELIGGFRSRADLVKKLLADPSCMFVSVCTTSDTSIAEVRNFRDQLAQHNYSLGKTVVNRVYEGRIYSDDELENARQAARSHFSAGDADYLLELFQKFNPLIRHDRNVIETLADQMGSENVIRVPLFLSDVHDVEGLRKISAILDRF